MRHVMKKKATIFETNHMERASARFAMDCTIKAMERFDAGLRFSMK